MFGAMPPTAAALEMMDAAGGYAETGPVEAAVLQWLRLVPLLLSEDAPKALHLVQAFFEARLACACSHSCRCHVVHGVLRSHHGYMTMSHIVDLYSCQRHGVCIPLHVPRLYRSPAARQSRQRPRSHRMSRTRPSTQRSRHLLSWLWPRWAKLPHSCPTSASLPASPKVQVHILCMTCWQHTAVPGQTLSIAQLSDYGSVKRAKPCLSHACMLRRWVPSALFCMLSGDGNGPGGH